MAKQCEQNTDQNYVVGRGRLFFDKFKDGCNQSEHGEQYFGNTPELSLSSDTETLDHYSSDYGLREKDLTVMLEHSRSGSFTTDNISADNLALFFLGNQSKVTQTQVTGAKELFEDVKLGRYIQLGTSDVLPMGVRNIENLALYVADADVTINVGEGDVSTIEGVTKVNMVGQVEYDLTQARLYLEPTATEIKDGQQLIAQYDIQTQARELIIARNRMIYGSLRFLSDNPVGDAKDFFWPKVMLQPDGDYALKGDDWQQIGFTFSVLRKNRKVEQVYIESAAARVADPKPEPEEVLTIKVNPSSGAHGTRFEATAKATKGGSPIEAAVSLLVTGQGLVTASGESINKRTDPTTGEATFNLDGVNQSDAAMIGKLRAINGKTQSTEINVTVAPEEKPVKVELKSDSSVAISGESITLTATVTKGDTKLKDVPVSFKATGDFTWTHEVEGVYTTDENGTVVAKPKTTVEIGEPGGSATFTASVTIDGVEATSNVVNITVRDEIVTVTLVGNPTQVDSEVPTTLTAEVKKGGVGYGPIPVRFRSDGKRTWQFDELSYEADASGVAIAKPFTTVEAGDVGGDYTFTASVTVGGKTITSNEITVNVVGVPAEP